MSEASLEESLLWWLTFYVAFGLATDLLGSSEHPSDKRKLEEANGSNVHSHSRVETQIAVDAYLVYQNLWNLDPANDVAFTSYILSMEDYSLRFYIVIYLVVRESDVVEECLRG